MNHRFLFCAWLAFLSAGGLRPALAAAAVSGELKQWHKITLTLDGPPARETDLHPNPFTDYRLTVSFTHESGQPRYDVPGYFAADGHAANTSATAGNQWRAHLTPDKPGSWRYAVSMLRGTNVALQDDPLGQPVNECHGLTGTFTVAPTDKSGRDFRAHGRLQYVGQHHLRFAGSEDYFLKAGADAPENLLAYADFDGTRSNKRRPARAGEATPAGLKTWKPHLQDWRPGDPTWKAGLGRGLIGALNYLAAKGANAFSCLTYNAGGDGDDVWPFVDRDDKLHYDCSKLDQWQIIFDHAQSLGLYLHCKMQETENDDLRGPGAAQSLDGGELGPQRRLYCREVIARFGHALALNWNLGEENTQTPAQQRAMAQYLARLDPYHHPIVLHTYPDWQDRVYTNLLGRASGLTGVSLQNSWNTVHQRTLQWRAASAQAGHPWVVANDEQNPAGLGVPPDAGYAGFSGVAREKETDRGYTAHDIRKYTLWGNLMAGGAGVEYYFGYKLPQNDLLCEDWRSRDQSWDHCRLALQFFHQHRIPFWAMENADPLVGNPRHDNTRYCLARPGELYVIYLPNGGTAALDLAGVTGAFTVSWYNPRQGGALRAGSVPRVNADASISLGQPPDEPTEDWVILLRR